MSGGDGLIPKDQAAKNAQVDADNRGAENQNECTFETRVEPNDCHCHVWYFVKRVFCGKNERLCSIEGIIIDCGGYTVYSLQVT